MNAVKTGVKAGKTGLRLLLALLQGVRSALKYTYTLLLAWVIVRTHSRPSETAVLIERPRLVKFSKFATKSVFLIEEGID